MNNRKYYEELFADYKDLVSFNEFRTMLGDIGEYRAFKLLRQGHVKSFFVHERYYIPKICIIDYLLGIGGIEKLHKDTSAKQPEPIVHRKRRKKAKSNKPKSKVKNKPPRRKPGTGCLYQINDHLWEGKYSPRNAHGQRISRNVYAKTSEECEAKLLEMIKQVDLEITIERIKIQQESSQANPK